MIFFRNVRIKLKDFSACNNVSFFCKPASRSWLQRLEIRDLFDYGHWGSVAIHSIPTCFSDLKRLYLPMSENTICFAETEHRVQHSLDEARELLSIIIEKLYKKLSTADYDGPERYWDDESKTRLLEVISTWDLAERNFDLIISDHLKYGYGWANTDWVGLKFKSDHSRCSNDLIDVRMEHWQAGSYPERNNDVHRDSNST